MTSINIATKSVRLIRRPILNAPTKEENIRSIKPAHSMNVVRMVAFTVVKYDVFNPRRTDFPLPIS